MATGLKRRFAQTRQTFIRLLGICTISLVSLAASASDYASEKLDVVALVTKSIDQTRGLSSYAEMSMLIKRPSWQRKSTLRPGLEAVRMR